MYYDEAFERISAMNQINPLLLESTVARRLVDNGTIIDPKTIRMMIRKGWLPTKKRTVRGLRRSATNVAKKHGFKVSTRDNIGINSITMPKEIPPELAKQQGTAFGYENVKPGQIRIPHDPSRYTYKNKYPHEYHMNPFQSAVISWHEGREAARSSSKFGQKFLKHQNELIPKAQAILASDPLKAQSMQKKTMKNLINYGGHMPGVMKDEAKLGNMLRRRYGFDPQTDLMRVPNELIGHVPSDSQGKIIRMPGELKLGKMTTKQDLALRRSLLPKFQ